MQVFDGDPSASKRIYKLRREVIEFQRAVEPLANVFDTLREQLKERASSPISSCGGPCVMSPTTRRGSWNAPRPSGSC